MLFPTRQGSPVISARFARCRGNPTAKLPGCGRLGRSSGWGRLAALAEIKIK